jgi:rubrerythrin
MKSLRETKTVKNLLKSFARESLSANKNSHYALIAKKEGYIEIANLFNEIASNEKEYSEKFMEYLANSDLNEEAVIISDAGYPVFLRDSKGKLLATSTDENEAFTTLYSNISDDDQDDNAGVLNSESNLWKCHNCDAIFEGDSAPEVCSVCENPNVLFEIFKENY